MDRRLTRKPPKGGASASKSELPTKGGNSLFDAEVNKNLLTHFFEQSRKVKKMLFPFQSKLSSKKSMANS